MGSLGARKGLKREGLERRDWKVGEARRTWGARMRLAWFEGRGSSSLGKQIWGSKTLGWEFRSRVELKGGLSHWGDNKMGAVSLQGGRSKWGEIRWTF